MTYQGKVVWITGASSGLGEAMAKAFNARGADLILSSRNTEALEKVRLSLDATKGRSAVIPLDLTEYQAFGDLARQAVQVFGQVDILVNNGGISQRSLAVDTPFEEERRLLETDLIGTLALTKAILPEILARKGQLVVIGSVMGKINTKYRSAYAAAKHGLTGYFESLRLEIAALGVNVCLILPGFIATQITRNALGATPDLIRESQNNQGMSAARFAEKALDAIQRRKGNVYIGGFREWLAMVVKRLSPALFDLLIVHQKVT